MQVAINYTSTFGEPLLNEDGTVRGENSGTHLLNLVLKMWDNPIIISSRTKQHKDLQEVELKKIKVNETLIINFDPISSMDLWRGLHRSIFDHPKIMNFVWFNLDEYHTPQEQDMLAYSFGMFPTFCNSKQSYKDAENCMRTRLSPSSRTKATIAYCNLGIDLVKADRKLSDKSLILYPAMYLFARKQPQKFIDIVSAVASVKELECNLFLNKKHLDNPLAVSLENNSVFNVLPIVDRKDYLSNIARHHAFIATSQNESYGLSYLEALYQGVIGVFPANKLWVDNIMPETYPFRYKDVNEAKSMLMFVLDNYDTLQEKLMPDIKKYIENNHNKTSFLSEFKNKSEQWYTEMSN